MLDIGHGDALACLLGEVEGVAGIQLEVVDSRTAVDCRPPIAHGGFFSRYTPTRWAQKFRQSSE